MAKTKETAKVAVNELADLITITREEWDRLQEQLAFKDERGANLTPAVEEGPHLRDPDIREAKLQQLREANEAGYLHPLLEGAVLPADMHDLLDEAGV